MAQEVKSTELTDLTYVKRSEVVPYYVDLIKNGNDDEVIRLNKLIIGKWSHSALSSIKREAWKQVRNP